MRTVAAVLALPAGVIIVSLVDTLVGGLWLFVMRPAMPGDSHAIGLVLRVLLEALVCAGLGYAAGRKNFPVTFVIGPAFLAVVDSLLLLVAWLARGESPSMLPLTVGCASLVIAFIFGWRGLHHESSGASA